MELRAAESKSLMRRRTGKVGRGAGTHAFLSSLFPPFRTFLSRFFFFLKNFLLKKKKKKLGHLLILADARSRVFDSFASKQSVEFSL